MWGNDRKKFIQLESAVEAAERRVQKAELRSECALLVEYRKLARMGNEIAHLKAENALLRYKLENPSAEVLK
jgi:hypothetical protein